MGWFSIYMWLKATRAEFHRSYIDTLPDNSRFEPKAESSKAPAIPADQRPLGTGGLTGKFRDNVDSEMRDIPLSSGGEHGDEGRTDDPLAKIPNIFCLLHLYQELSSGGLGLLLFRS